jgi:His/Glu/Gln/Arg/opine family amino acid ABC transporter permease subunit
MTFDWSVIWQNAGALAQGTAVTVALTALTMAVAIPIGVLLAVANLSRSKLLVASSGGFITLFRNLPALLVIYATYYVLPVVLDFGFPPFLTALIALSMTVSAYNGDTFRSGIGSIRRGQTEAALALGMSEWQVMRQVVMPQAGRRVLPVLANTWVSLFKDTSLVSVIAVGELAYTAMNIRSQTFRVLEILTAMAAIYWALGYPQAKLVDWIQRHHGLRE